MYAVKGNIMTTSSTAVLFTSYLITVRNNYLFKSFYKEKVNSVTQLSNKILSKFMVWKLVPALEFWILNIQDFQIKGEYYY